VSLYFTMGRPFPRSKLPHSMGGSGLLRFPGPTQVLNPNGISINVGVFAGLTSVTDKPTDRQTKKPCYSVGNNMPHLRMYNVVLQRGLKRKMNVAKTMETEYGKKRRSQVSVTGQSSGGNISQSVGTIGTIIILTLLILATNPTEPYSTTLTDTVGQASIACTH